MKRDPQKTGQVKPPVEELKETVRRLDESLLGLSDDVSSAASFAPAPSPKPDRRGTGCHRRVAPPVTTDRSPADLPASLRVPKVVSYDAFVEARNRRLAEEAGGGDASPARAPEDASDFREAVRALGREEAMRVVREEVYDLLDVRQEKIRNAQRRIDDRFYERGDVVWELLVRLLASRAGKDC